MHSLRCTDNFYSHNACFWGHGKVISLLLNVLDDGDFSSRFFPSISSDHSLWIDMRGLPKQYVPADIHHKYFSLFVVENGVRSMGCSSSISSTSTSFAHSPPILHTVIFFSLTHCCVSWHSCKKVNMRVLVLLHSNKNVRRPTTTYVYSLWFADGIENERRHALNVTGT